MATIKPEINKVIEVSNELIVSVEEVGKWINLAQSAITMQYDLIKDLIVTATEIIENYTWISLRRKKIEAYYDLEDLFYSFCNGNEKLLLNRSPIIQITDIEKIEYLANNIWNEFDRGIPTIDGLYENTTEKIEKRDWATIYFDESVPYETRDNAYKVRVTYSIGYLPTETDTAAKIPTMFKTAIKKIVAFHYTNRGDCSSECNLNGYPVPCDVKGMLSQMSVSKTVIGGCYGC